MIVTATVLLVWPGEKVTVPDAETAKTAEVASRLWSELGVHSFTRSDAVVAVGGGSVTDLAGFVAATWLRGVTVVHVPTTLLGMVDAAIGGKTGVNLPEGKNLVGAFWQPLAVLCDTDALATLPLRELRCGQGELAKYHFLTGDDLLALDLDERIAAAVGIKARIVAADEREDPTSTAPVPGYIPRIFAMLVEVTATNSFGVSRPVPTPSVQSSGIRSSSPPVPFGIEGKPASPIRFCSVVKAQWSVATT